MYVPNVFVCVLDHLCTCHLCKCVCVFAHLCMCSVQGVCVCFICISVFVCVCLLICVCFQFKVCVCVCAETKVLIEHTLVTQACDVVNPDDVDANGDTALHVVVKSPPFTPLHHELAVLLINSGVLPNVRDRARKMPRDYVPNNFMNADIYERVTLSLTRPGTCF